MSIVNQYNANANPCLSSNHLNVHVTSPNIFIFLIFGLAKVLVLDIIIIADVMQTKHFCVEAMCLFNMRCALYSYD